MSPRASVFWKYSEWAFFIIGSWYWMQIVHELGHVLGAMLTGGSVQRVVLELLSFSRTDVEQNPRPFFVVWMGPLLGSLVPLALWLVARAMRWRIRGLFGFFAGFCLIANGAYIGMGSFDGVGDAGDMLSLGSPAWTLWAFGLITIFGGLWVWHRLDKRLSRADEKRMWPSGLFALSAVLVFVVV